MALSKIGSNQIDTAATPTFAELDVDNVKVNGNTISSTDTNGDITLDPNGTGDTIVASGNVGIGAAPNATFGSTLYVQDTPSANKPILSVYSQGNSNNAGIAILNDAGNRGIWTESGNLRFTSTYEGNSTEHMRIDSNGDVGIGSQPYQGRLWIDGDDLWLFGNNTERAVKFAIDNNTDSIPNTSLVAKKGGGTEGILEARCWNGSNSLNAIFKAVGNENVIAGGTAGRSVAFAHAGVAIDRTWGNYPGITVMHTSDSGQTNQGEFRVHGANTRYSDYPADNGSDFGINFRIDGTNYYNNSDQRSKTNIVDNPRGLDEILQLTPRKFDRIKADGTIQPHLTNVLGFVAQEVEPILPEAVIHYADEDDGTDGYNTAYSTSDGPIVSTLVNAVKEQQTIINGLISRIEALEAG